jgi:sugar phosphate isomerase/epimerase
MIRDRFVASPCCQPSLGFEESLAAYSELGFGKIELFTDWTGAKLDLDADPAAVRRAAESYGLEIVSVHLPPVDEEPGSLGQAVAAANLSAALGARTVTFRARSLDDYLRTGPTFLASIRDLPARPVLQNHSGTALSTVDDCARVLEGLDDERWGCILEVGHFAKAGQRWQDACDRFGRRVVLVHLKDIAAGECVPFGQGEIDFPEVFSRLETLGYEGDFVLEIEGAPRDEDFRRHLRDGIEYLTAR